ncbi:MAG: FAD-dependent oxidoreductase [Actinomycetota bacterium]|nr:FAD-dependent oxidoreductase [Actinomycetota bacterium]
MTLPVLVAIDDDASSLDDVERELQDRYARHYRVVCLKSPDEARTCLDELASSGADVALVLARLWMSGRTGAEVLDEVRLSHPHARRVLLIEWGEWGEKRTGEAIFEGVSHGRFEHYLLRPSSSPDELFHQAISSMLLDWADSTRTAPHTIHVVGESWSGRAYELRETLQQCAIPHKFCLADSEEGRSLVASAGDGVELPIIVFPNGEILVNPTNSEMALAAGSPVSTGQLEFDVVVVGAGPAGLSAAVYGASEGLSTLVIDRGGIGGQATSSSLIRNYLGFPRGISGRKLARAAYDQAWVFGARFAFMQTVTDITARDGSLELTLTDDTRIVATSVLLTMGASYRRLDVPALEELTGAGVFYGGPTSEAPALEHCNVFVVGGANSAGQAALHLATYAQQVTLVVRGSSLRAGMSDYLVRQVEATANIDVRLGTEVVGGGGTGRLEHLVLRDRATSDEVTVDAQALFLLIGAQPHTDWLPPSIQRDERGFVLTGADLDRSAWLGDRDPFPLETSLPGVFAGGDARHGSVKRVASAVGEGSIAVQFIHRYFAAEGLEPRGRSVQYD